MKHAIRGLLAVVCSASTALAGPLTISPDGRDLLDDGQRVFFNAATPWHILTRLDRDETLQYLDARQSDGFNALMLALVVTDGYHISNFNNAYGDAPFTTENDFSTPNEAYFEHVDWFMDEVASRDMWILLLPAYLGYECGPEGWCNAMKQMGTNTLRDYGRFVGIRYGGYDNIVWVHAGDANASAYGALDEVEAVLDGIEETQSGNQLLSAHCNRGNSAADCYNRPWLQINNSYSHCTGTPAEVKRDYERSPTRPFFYIEGRYENENATQTCLRSQAYWSILGGAMGHFFGNNPMWDFENGWEQELGSPGSDSMRHFGNLFESRDHGTLEPDYDHEVLVAGYGNINGADYAAAASSFNGTSVIVYTPSQRTLTVDTTRVAGERGVVWWYDPSNGLAIFVSTVPTDGTHEFTPPSSGDWVLVIDSEDADLPQPGTQVPVAQASFGSIKSIFGQF